MKSFDLKLRILLAQFTWALAVMTFCRLVFYYFNADHFQQVNGGVFTAGIRFDFSALFWILLPFLSLSIINLLIDLPKAINNIRHFLFHLGLIVSVLFNLIDVEYYKFTLKRSTFDLFTYMGQGDDIYTLAPKFLLEFWYLDLIFIVLALAVVYVYKKIENASFKVPDKERNWISKSVITLFLAAFFVIGGRGGLQLIPLGVVDAGMFVSSQNVPLVLNTPFSIVRTMGKEGIPGLKYYSEDELKQRFTPISNFENAGNFKNKNVVIIILESFSMEFVRNDEKGRKLTPFLQELKKKSEFYTRFFSNGKKSIEALPTIMSGIPTLMDEPFISSSYGVNAFESFATYLRPKGYHTSFFHGGKNGTMNFNGFISAADFDAYYGKDEYPDPEDYDGTWGIFDEPYLQYFGKTIGSFKQPFLSSIFTLSSHHPYTIPEQHQGKFNEGTTPLEKTVQYSDYSLRRFFESIENEAWYKNTLFVITADHTPDTETQLFQRAMGRYHVPLFIFDPMADTSYASNKICQHMDILPTVLDKLNYSGPVFGFGKSIYGQDEGVAVQYINNSYQIIKGDVLYQSNLNAPLALYNISKDPLLENNLLGSNTELEKQLDDDLKAVIQSYSQRLNANKLKAQ